MKRLFLSVGLMALASAAHAQLFTPNGAFQVQSNAAPGTGTDNASLTIGTAQALLNAGNALRVFTAPGTDLPGAEWLVFEYMVNPGFTISASQGNWSLNEVGLPATKSLDLIRGFTQFDVNGTNAAFNTSPFSNYSPSTAPPTDLASLLSGPGLLTACNCMPTGPVGGPGGLPSLGAFINPFSQLNGDLAGGVTSNQLTSYTLALEFSPAGGVSTVPEPSTWAMMALGFGVMGFLGYRKTRSALA
jgi:hypothetical protein